MNANGRESCLENRFGWPCVPVGEMASPADRNETVVPEKEYRQLGVRLWGKGAYARESIDGVDTKYKTLNRVATGDIVVNKIWARNGSVSVVQSDLDGCYVSGEFPLYSPNPGALLPDWFLLASKCRWFWHQCDELSRGTSGKNRIKPSQFLRVKIPLPPLPEQKRIVDKVQSLTSKIDEAQELRSDINTDRIAALRSLFRRLTDGAPRRPMSEVAPLERRPVQIKEDESYPELGIRSFGRGTFHKPTLQGSELTWQKLFHIHSGDIVLSNIKAWEGAIGVATEEDHNRVGSHRYLTCVVNPDAATANFVSFYLLTREGLEHVGHASPGSADRNRTLGMRALMDIPVPVPALHIQHHFDRVHRQMAETTDTEAQSGKKLDALVPAVLDRAFKGAL